MSVHRDIGEMMSSQHCKEKAVNRVYLSKIFENILFLGRQGLPMRGNWIPNAGESESGGCERESNFHQLLLLRAVDDPGILDILKRKTHKYTDHPAHPERAIEIRSIRSST